MPLLPLDKHRNAHMTADKPSDRKPEPTDMAVMSLGEHLEELRSRLIKCLAAFGAAFILCWVFKWTIIAVIKRPHVQAMSAYELEGILNYRSYFEPVVAQLKACGIIALVVTAPWLIYQIWAFVAPGLFPHERRKVIWLGAPCVLCFMVSVAFGYFVFIPIALRYLLSFAGPGMQPALMISDYLNVFLLMTLALGIAFQTPVVVYFLVRWRILQPESLAKSRRGIILGAFIVGAVITPPDPLTQIMMAVTLIVLYDIGGLIAAPSRTTFMGFLKFTGVVAVLGGGLGLWYHFWPVAQLSAIRGVVTADGKAVAPAQTVGVTRGSACITGAGGAARLAVGGAGGPRVLLDSDARLQVHGPDSFTLLRGACWVDNPDAKRELVLRTLPANAVLQGARADFDMLDAERVRIRAFSGYVQVKAGGQTRRIAAGQEDTFRLGGEPADLTGAEKRWQELGAGAESVP